MITGQQIISSEGQGASSALSWGTSTGCSPTHTGHVSGLQNHGRPVMLFSAQFVRNGGDAKLRILSPAG
jgi:hypothetical protein